MMWFRLLMFVPRRLDVIARIVCILIPRVPMYLRPDLLSKCQIVHDGHDKCGFSHSTLVKWCDFFHRKWCILGKLWNKQVTRWRVLFSAIYHILFCFSKWDHHKSNFSSEYDSVALAFLHQYDHGYAHNSSLEYNITNDNVKAPIAISYSIQLWKTVGMVQSSTHEEICVMIFHILTEHQVIEPYLDIVRRCPIELSAHSAGAWLVVEGEQPLFAFGKPMFAYILHDFLATKEHPRTNIFSFIPKVLFECHLKLLWNKIAHVRS